VTFSVSSGLSVPSGLSVSAPEDVGVWVTSESVTRGSDVDPNEICCDESVEVSLELSEMSVLEESTVCTSVDDSVVDDEAWKWPVPVGNQVVDEKVVVSTPSSASVTGASVLEESVSTTSVTMDSKISI
jgi:hypothetical protein